MNLYGLIPAAGRSSRTSGFKLLYPWPPEQREIMNRSGQFINPDSDKNTIIESVLKKMLPFCSTILIISGATHNQLFQLAEKYDEVRLVFNKNWQKGMISSIYNGLKECLNKAAEGIVYCPADYPGIQADTFKMVVEQGMAASRICMPVLGSESGPPVYLPAGEAESFYQSKWQENFRSWLTSRSVQYINTNDPWILRDIDSDSDYKESISYFLK